MSHTLTETQTFDAPTGMTVPSDGDAETAASVAAVTAPTGFQALADRTQWLKLMIPATMWVGPRPYLATADGSNSSLVVGPTTALILNGFYLTGSSSVTTISGLTGLNHGNWYYVYASPPTTTIAVGSNNVVLPTGTINAASTTGFPSSGTVWVATSNGVQLVTYGGTSGGNQFTGCTGGTGTMSTGGAVNGTTINYTTSTAGPDNSNTYLGGVTTSRYVGSFRADHGGFVMQFRAVNGRYIYVSGGGSSTTSNTVLGGGTASVATTITNVPLVGGDLFSLIPPTSRHGIFAAQSTNPTGSNQTMTIAETTGYCASTYAYQLAMPATNSAEVNVTFDMPTDSNQEIAYKSSDVTNNAAISIQVLGYMEPWGQ